MDLPRLIDRCLIDRCLIDRCLIDRCLIDRCLIDCSRPVSSGRSLGKALTDLRQ